MFSIISNVKFNNHKNNFQKTIAKDLHGIKNDEKNDEKLLISADKTTNFYKLDVPSYNKSLDTAITKSSKKAPSNSTRSIISEEKSISNNLNLDDRIDSLAPKDSFITLKDHKPPVSPILKRLKR